jgi:hypothetical protein
MSSAQVLKLPMIFGVRLMIFGVLISQMVVWVTRTLARELMLDTSDRLSGLARGASPNQSSWMRSSLKPGLGVCRFSVRLVLLVMGKTGEGWLLVE